MRAGQAADVSGQDAFAAALHGLTSGQSQDGISSGGGTFTSVTRLR